MKQFFSIINFIKTLQKHTDAKDSFCEPLIIEEKLQKLYLKTPNIHEEPVKFFSWFRWLYLIAATSIGISGFSVLKSESLFINIVSICFFILCVFIGLLGAFYIVPTMIKIFTQFNAIFGDTKNFPYLDLKKSQIKSPVINEPIDIHNIIEFIYEDSSQKNWLQLCVNTKDNESIFLINYPQSQQTLIEEYKQIIIEKMKKPNQRIELIP